MTGTPQEHPTETSADSHVELPPGISIVIPTYREAGNLANITERIAAVMVQSGVRWELIFVDDDSGDGSEDVVRMLSEQHPVRMEVRRQPPRDLSLSVIEGIRLSRYEHIVSMDADLSHPPEKIMDMIAALSDDDCDMVVGSRYVSGGATDEGWGLWRMLNSRFATLLALPLVRCRDPMSGFFAINRRTVPPLETLRPVGYKIGLELMVRGRLRTKEVPIDFADRSVGESKMSTKQQINYLRHLLRLYVFKLGRLGRVLSYGAVGTLGFLIDVTIYFALQGFGLEHRLARSLSFWPSITTNWWLNRHVTFGDRARKPRGQQWAEFVLASLVGLAVNVGGYWVLTTYVDFFDHHRMAAFVLGIGLGAVVNYIASDLYVYRHHKPKQTPEDASSEQTRQS